MKNHEVGGILLGLVFKDYCEIVKITLPNKFDRFGHNFFIRSKKGAQPRIDNAWSKSDGTIIYLGEWHSHKENNPKPSLTDKELIKNSLRTTKMEIDFLFLIIVGQNCNLWVAKQTKNKLIELIQKK